MTVEHDVIEHHDEHDHHSDTVQLPGGREITVPGGIYTVVFAILGILTIIEVISSEIFVDGLKIVILLGLAVAKATLVILYYMHLRHDNRFFAVVLIAPLLVTTLSVLYLFGIPPQGY